MHINGSFNNQAGRDILINQVINPLGNLLAALDLGTADSEELIAIAGELQRYFSERDVVGLEAKLISAGREDLLEDAIYEKHRFSQRLALVQFSLQLRNVYHHVLALLVMKFKGGVLPLIVSGASARDVDAAVMNLVSEVYAFTSASSTLNLTATDIHAMIFFLTGNCHLKWAR